MKPRSPIAVILALAVALALAATADAHTNPSAVTLASRPGVTAYGPIYSYAAPGDPAWGAAKSAVAAYVHPSWPALAGAAWISTAFYKEDTTGQDSWRWFHDQLVLPCTAYNIATNAKVTADSDNAEAFYFNGAFVGGDGTISGPFVDNLEWSTLLDYPITPHAGTNTLDFIVRNYRGSADPKLNPTGLIYKSTVNYKVPSVRFQGQDDDDEQQAESTANGETGDDDGQSFQLLGAGGKAIDESLNVYLVIHQGSIAGPVLKTVTPSFTDGTYSYGFALVGLAAGTYTAVVVDACTNEALGVRRFHSGNQS